MKRPNGEILKKIGAGLVALSALILIVILFFSSPIYDKSWPDDFSQAVFIWFPTIVVLCFPAGVLSWLTGHIVFAISFLPEKND
jgi:hypothetical protein